jgi:tetratricopeptide (TPR) repeat protein
VLAPAAARGAETADDRGVAAEARDAYRAGLERFRARDYTTAVREFERAYSLYPKPELLYDIAQALRLGGRCSTALEYYERFLATQPVEPLLSRATARSNDLYDCGENAQPKGSNALASRDLQQTKKDSPSTANAAEGALGAKADPAVVPTPRTARTATTTPAVAVPVVIGTGTVAVASAVFGLVAYGRYVSANEQAEKLCTNTPPDACSELELREHSRQTSAAHAARTWFYAGMGTAAVATAVTITLLAWPRTSEPQVARSVRVDAGLRGGAVAARVSLTW